MTFADFEQIWFTDFEFSAPPGDRPQPICMVALEFKSGNVVRLWMDELRKLPQAPYRTGSGVLIVAFYASAEISCHLALGWPLPSRLLDLYVEFRNRTNRDGLQHRASLLDAMGYMGLDAMEAVEKESMRQLALRGGPWTAHERRALLDYCEADVRAIEKLFKRMLDDIDVPRALLRGRYMVAAARMEHIGVPIDTASLMTLRENWERIKGKVVERVDPAHEIYDRTTFKVDRFGEWIRRRAMPWPRLPSGQIRLDDETFRNMALLYPEVVPIREVRESLSQLRLANLQVGQDGRNRVLLSAFRSKTGRNQPSNSKFVFGMPSWVRGLIQPVPGTGLAHLDWAQQEFGIAAALSRDSAMQQAYLSGDPYLMFAKQAGAIPRDGTKASHPEKRELFKQCALAVLYGMSEDSLAVRIGRSVAEARELLNLHHKTYARFWTWSDGVVAYAVLKQKLHTAYGWTLHVRGKVNERSLRNFPMQANGAEAMRLACSAATEHGISVCAPIHDAILVEALLVDLENIANTTQDIMVAASAAVLDGFPLRSDVTFVRYPDRYDDPRGRRMWKVVWDAISQIRENMTDLSPFLDRIGTLPAHDCAPAPSYICP